MCLYVYVYTYIHTYIHAYIHTYIQTNIHTYMHQYIYLYIHFGTHLCTHVLIKTESQKKKHMRTNTLYINAHVQKLKYLFIYVIFYSFIYFQNDESMIRLAEFLLEVTKQHGLSSNSMDFYLFIYLFIYLFV